MLPSDLTGVMEGDVPTQQWVLFTPSCSIAQSGERAVK